MSFSALEIGFLISTIFVFVYVMVIVYFIFGWVKMNPQNTVGAQSKNSNTPVSIVIAARNEEDNIGYCLRSIFAQDLSVSMYELIIVNDHSEDDTKDIAAQFKNPNLKLLDLPDNETGKKAAIKMGIQAAKNELIVLIDADCTVGVNFLRTIISFYETSKADMILLPVLINDKGNFFVKIQSLESLSLLAVNASTANLNSPLLANGAGLVYSKRTFEALNGFEGNLHFPGGDDMMMLEKMKLEKSRKISFLFAPKAMVETDAAIGFSAFFDQRVRWASKTKHYTDKRTKVLAALVFITAVSLVFTGVSGLLCFETKFLIWAGSLLIFKSIFDFLFLFLAAKPFDRLQLMVWFLPVQLFYPFYVLIVGLFSMFSSFTWKGRVYKVNDAR